MDKFIIIHEEVNYDRFEDNTYCMYYVEGSDQSLWLEDLILEVLSFDIDEDEDAWNVVEQNKQLVNERIRIKRDEMSSDVNLYTFDEYESIGVDYHNADWEWVVLKKSYDSNGKEYNKNNVEYKHLTEALQIDNPIVKALMDKIKYENTLHQWIMQQEEDGVEVDRELLMKYDVYIPKKGGK